MFRKQKVRVVSTDKGKCLGAGVEMVRDPSSAWSWKETEDMEVCPSFSIAGHSVGNTEHWS